MSYIQELREIADIHYTDFHHEDATSLEVEIPNITQIDELLLFLREKNDYQETKIYTKFTKTLQDFKEHHQLSNIEIIEVHK